MVSFLTFGYHAPLGARSNILPPVLSAMGEAQQKGAMTERVEALNYEIVDMMKPGRWIELGSDPSGAR